MRKMHTIKRKIETLFRWARGHYFPHRRRYAQIQPVVLRQRWKPPGQMRKFPENNGSPEDANCEWGKEEGGGKVQPYQSTTVGEN